MQVVADTEFARPISWIIMESSDNSASQFVRVPFEQLWELRNFRIPSCQAGPSS